MKKYGPIVIYSLILVVFTALAASGVTLLGVSAHRLRAGETVTISQEEYSILQSYKKLDEVRQAIHTYYVNDSADEDLVEGAAYGMVGILGDPYSSYLSPESMQALAQEDSGEYIGIGCSFIVDAATGLMTVTHIYPNSPASEAGVQVGDQLYAVEGESVVGMDQTSIAALMKGEEGTSVAVTLQRGNTQVDYTLARRKVDIIDVDYRMIGEDVLYIQLSAFSTNADAAFEEALKFGQKQKAKGVLLDLRGNGGGGADILEPIADLLLPEGLIFYSEDKAGNRTEQRSNAYRISLPLVVLCDENTASASEVLISAIQDYGVGTIVGKTTFGKGVGQSVYPIGSDGSGVYLTCVTAFSPKGRSWNGVGLEPDVVVDQPEELVANPLLRTEENDVQLIEALRILRDQIG